MFKKKESTTVLVERKPRKKKKPWKIIAIVVVLLLVVRFVAGIFSGGKNMGLGEMLGVKNIKIETKTPMTLEEFFDKIKDVTFEAGVPSIVKHGFNTVICFPKIDRENI